MNNSGITPKFYRILVQLEEVADKTKGGIFLPDDTVEKETMAQARGTVLAIGRDSFNDLADSVDVGDVVIFPRYEGTEVKGNDDKMYRLIEDKHIIGTA